MPDVATATIRVTPILEGAQQTLTDELTNAAGTAGTSAGTAAGTSLASSMSSTMTSTGTAMSKSVTAPIMAIGTAAVASWKSVDVGLDTIVAKTGATGEALDEMHGILENITTSMPVDFETAGAAIGEINTRFGSTGQELQDLSSQFLMFARLNNTDVSNSVDSVQKALSAFGMDASEAGHMLDTLNAVGQATGVSVDTLTSGLIQNATAFQQMGLDADQAALFMGNMEKSGANSETVMQGLRKALKNAAEDGLDMNEALAQLQDSILNGADGMDGLTAAYDLFGRSGDQIYGAIQNGTLDFTALGEASIEAGGSVADTFNNTVGPMDDFTSTMNELKIAGSEIIEAAGPALKEVLGGIADAAKGFGEAWGGLSPEMQEMIIKVAGIAALVGPLLIVGGKVIGGISTISSGIGGLVGKIGGLGSSAASAAAPVASAGASFGTMAGQALQLLAAAAALYITAQAFSVLVDAAIRITDAGWPAIAVLAGMAGAIVGLMAAASAFGPALTAGAIGIGVFGAAMLAIGGGIDLAAQGIAKVTEAITDLVDVVLSHADEINSIVTTIGETVNGTILTISDGISGIIDSLSEGISGVLDSVAGIIDSIGTAALNAGTGFEKLANAVMNLVNNTGVLDLGATLGTVAAGVKDISKAASEAGSGATSMNALASGMKNIVTAGAAAGASMTNLDKATRKATTDMANSFKAMNLAAGMRSAMNGAVQSAAAGINQLRSMFANTRFSFNQHIAVPHFTMSGNFNAQTKAVPAISTRWYAKAAEYGALFTSPTIIGVGDASQPEILLGEEKLKELVKGGTTVTNYITVSGAEDPEAWASKFAKQIKLEMRMA